MHSRMIRSYQGACHDRFLKWLGPVNIKKKIKITEEEKVYLTIRVEVQISKGPGECEGILKSRRCRCGH